MGPVKCRVCGVAEWRHVCGPLSESKLAGVTIEGRHNAVTSHKPVTILLGHGTLPQRVVVQPGEMCPTCHCRKPKKETAAERKAASRARKKVAP